MKIWYNGIQALEEFKSESDQSCMENEDDNNFDVDHASQSSCGSEMEQEPTNKDEGNADFIHLDDGENSNVSIYLTGQDGQAMKWNEPVLELVRILAGVRSIG